MALAIDQSIKEYKSEFQPKHVLIDMLGTYGFIPGHKPAGAKKDAFEASEYDSIPAELIETGTVVFYGGKNENGLVATYVCLKCVEGDQVFELEPGNTVIGWGVSDKTSTGYNAWRITDWRTLLERKPDGQFVTKAILLRFYPVTETIPTALEALDIQRTSETTFEFPYEWGENGRGTALIGEGYWVVNGWRADGAPKVYYLRKGEAGYEQMIVCTLDDQGEIDRDLGRLADLDPVAKGE